VPGVLLRGSSMPSVLSIRVSKILWFVHLESLGVRSKMAALALSLTTLSRLRVVDTVAVSTCAREICVCMMYIINTVYVCVYTHTHTHTHSRYNTVAVSIAQ